LSSIRSNTGGKKKKNEKKKTKKKSTNTLYLSLSIFLFISHLIWIFFTDKHGTATSTAEAADGKED
jgi:cytoskeletal protein RodZ